MNGNHRLILCLAWLIVTVEVALTVNFYSAIISWIEHHLWIVAIPFAKVILKKLSALNFIAIINALIILLWNFTKLGVIKLLKTIGLRYGLFFSQYRWYFIRKNRILFLRKGKQFFRYSAHFWNAYTYTQKIVVLIAFFPIAIVIFMMGLSFNITRKTMVQKTQEAAMVKVATSASQRSLSIISAIAKLDGSIIKKIKAYKEQFPTTNKEDKQY